MIHRQQPPPQAQATASNPAAAYSPAQAASAPVLLQSKLGLSVEIALKDLKESNILDYTHLSEKVMSRIRSMPEQAVLESLVEYKNSNLLAVKNKEAYLYGILMSH